MLIQDSCLRPSSISGRSTHVSKIRSEFDAGGDYNLLECGPGEIDPHAVSSVLKAYLREREFLLSNEDIIVAYGLPQSRSHF